MYNYSFNLGVEKAYIITLPNNKFSLEYSQRCQASCERVGMDYVVWEGFDGTDNKTIKVPEQFKEDSFFKMLKWMNEKISISQLSCLLSHVSLWLECAKIDKPIVILEHDAIMIKKFDSFNSYNSLIYMGCREWVKENWGIFSLPPFGSEGKNYRFMLRTHAYAIDPPMAKNLLAHILRYGLYETADFMLRVDLFNVTHQGVYAYDEQALSTINNKMFETPDE